MLCISPFKPDRKMPGQQSSLQSRRNPCGTLLAQSDLVLQTFEISVGTPSAGTPQEDTPDPTRKSQASPPKGGTKSASLSIMRRAYQNRGFSEHATNIVLQSWRQSSRQPYDVHIKKWLLFCSDRKIDPIQPPVGTAVDFLAMLYEKRFSYSSINTTRCALPAILDPYGASRTTFGEHPDVKRFMKGIQYSVSTPFTSLQ